MTEHAGAATVLITAGANTDLEFYLRPEAKKFLHNLIEGVKPESRKK